MSHSSFPSDGQSDTPWWHETPSLASQTTYSQSTFAGASISQLTNPFSMSSEREGGSQSDGDDSDEGRGRSFLIPSIDTNTGQSLSTDFSGPLKQRQLPTSGKYSFISSAENVNSFQARHQTPSGSSPQQSRVSVSLPRTQQHFQSGSLAKKTPGEGGHMSKTKGKSKSMSWHRSGGKKDKENEQVQPVEDSSANGVFNVTLKCQIHLHSENGDLKRSSSNIELVPAPGSNLPIILPGSVTMAPTVTQDTNQMAMYSPITEENSLDYSPGILSPDRGIHSGDDMIEGLTPVSLSSDESVLSPSVTSANQDILNYLWPQFMQYLNPGVLVPVLTQHNLLTSKDLKYLSHPLRTIKEQRKRILASAPVANFDLFVECISMEKSDSGHVYLTRRLREAIEKKRSNPFKRLSSLRGKERGVAGKPTPLSLAKDRHSPHSSATPSPRTPTKTNPKTTSKKKSSTKFTPGDAPFHSILESGSSRAASRESGETSYESSTLPRRFSSDIKQDSRGSKPYSSARYTSNTPTVQSRPRSKLSRHGSFQGASDIGRVQVTPLLRDPTKLSQENSDVLENLSHFKTSVFQFPPTSQEPGDYSYQSMMRESAGSPFSSSHSQAVMGSDRVIGGRDSLRRGKKVSDPSQYTTILEAESETTESPDVPPPTLPVKKRRQSFSGSDLKKPSTIAVTRFSSNATPSDLAKRGGQVSPTLVSESEISEPNSSLPRQSSNRKESPKRTTPLKRGSSMYTATDSPSRHYPLTKHDVSYMPAALSPLPNSPAPQTNHEETPPPVPVKQRTHRRTQSYDTSQASIDFVTFPTPQHTRPHTHKHSSLRRDATPSSMNFHSNTPRTADSSSQVPIISTQDSGITSSFDRAAPSVSNYSLCTDPGSSVSKYSGAFALDPASEAVMMKRFEWLQEKVRFKKAPEDIVFASRTHFNQERIILNSGTLYERGQPKFVVLLTDMLLILKPRKRTRVLPGRLGSWLSSSPGPVLDWFSDLDCVCKMPLLLHHLSVRSLSKKKEPQVLYLHYDNDSEMLQFTLHSVSKEAKDIWVDCLNTAIVSCTRAQANTVLPVGNEVRWEPVSSTYTQLTLTIVEANNVAVGVDAKTRDHFCSVQLGDKRCKTPSVQAQCWPTWNYKIEFVDFSLTETVFIEFYTERITSPDEYLGGVDIQLMAVAQRLKVNMSQGVSTLQLKNQHLPLKNGKGTLTLDFELGWVNKGK